MKSTHESFESMCILLESILKLILSFVVIALGFNRVAVCFEPHIRWRFLLLLIITKLWRALMNHLRVCVSCLSLYWS